MVKSGTEPESALLALKYDVARNLVAAHVKDKVGFFEEVAKLSEDRPISPVGELEQVTAQGDSATGHSKMSITPGPGESPPAVEKIDKTFRFRRINGGWLLDSL